MKRTQSQAYQALRDYLATWSLPPRLRSVVARLLVSHGYVLTDAAHRIYLRHSDGLTRIDHHDN